MREGTTEDNPYGEEDKICLQTETLFVIQGHLRLGMD